MAKDKPKLMKDLSVSSDGPPQQPEPAKPGPSPGPSVAPGGQVSSGLQGSSGTPKGTITGPLEESKEGETPKSATHSSAPKPPMPSFPAPPSPRP